MYDHESHLFLPSGSSVGTDDIRSVALNIVKGCGALCNALYTTKQRSGVNNRAKVVQAAIA